jgi:excisionase family DNA binding protein
MQVNSTHTGEPVNQAENSFLTIAQAAALLGVCPATIRRMIKKRRLPVVKLSRGLQRVTYGALMQVLDAATEGGAA